MLGLEFDTQTSAHRHIATELDWRDTSTRIPIRHAADMLRHRIGREEKTGAPLDIDTLQSIGIVADPELIEVR